MKEKYITKRKRNGHVIYEVNFKYFDKETKTFSKSFNSKDYGSPKEALDKAIMERDRIRLALKERRLASSKSTLKDVYEECKEIIPLTSETDRKHDLIFNRHIKPFDKRITDISSKDITLSLTRAINKSQDSINRIFSVWKRIFKCAMVCDYIKVNPCDKVIVPQSQKINKPRNQKLDISILEIVECVKESKGINKDLIAYALILMYYLGLRPSECFALTKNDFKNGYVSINKAVGTSHNGEKGIKKTKTYSSIRKLPIPKTLKPIIKDLFKMQPSNYLFEKHNGELLDSTYVSNYLRKISKRKGIEFRAYMLRHNFATSLISKNTDIRTVMELMGHSSSSMSIEYARSNDKLKKEALESIE
jgi:integrase